MSVDFSRYTGRRYKELTLSHLQVVISWLLVALQAVHCLVTLMFSIYIHIYPCIYNKSVPFQYVDNSFLSGWNLRCPEKRTNLFYTLNFNGVKTFIIRTFVWWGSTYRCLWRAQERQPCNILNLVSLSICIRAGGVSLYFKYKN